MNSGRVVKRSHAFIFVDTIPSSCSTEIAKEDSEEFRMLRRCVLSASLWAVLLACAGGCSDSQRAKVFPVRGKLLIGGKPAAGAHLVFHPLNPQIVSRAVGVTKPDGSFQLMTHSAADGAPAGDYVVTIFWHDDSVPEEDCEHHDEDHVEHDRLHGLYFDSTKSPLRATVRRGSNDLTIKADGPVEPTTETTEQSPTES